MPASGSTTGGYSVLSVPTPKLQDFNLYPCSVTADDGGCSAISIVIRENPNLCWRDYQAIGVAGNVSAGSIIGVPLSVDDDAGPSHASVYIQEPQSSGSTGASDYAHSGTVTFTAYEFAPDGGTGRVAGTFSVNDEAAVGGGFAQFTGPLSGTFDSANPDCSCSYSCSP